MITIVIHKRSPAKISTKIFARRHRQHDHDDGQTVLPWRVHSDSKNIHLKRFFLKVSLKITRSFRYRFVLSKDFTWLETRI